MKAWLWVLIVGMVVLNAVAVPGVMANVPHPAGEAVQLDAVDNTGATGEHYLITWVSRGIALAMGIFGATQFASRPMLGVGGVGGGGLVAFWPSIVNNLQEKAAASVLPCMGCGGTPAPGMEDIGAALVLLALFVVPGVLAYRRMRRPRAQGGVESGSLA